MSVTALRLRRRAAGGAVGAPATLMTAEPAYNMQDGVVYMGYGDNGSGVATSIKRIGADNFWQNVPDHGGTAGKALVSTLSGMQWGDLPEGALYTASGNGIELSGSAFSLNFSEIATGLNLATTYAPINHTHGDADITALSATKLTGTIDVARLPAALFAPPIVASGGIASLTSGQQNEIFPGTSVVTSDGREWRYVSGSKTAEASYYEMADRTPEWSVIANKPTFATVATSGAYSDLTGRPTLGTMAAQNANAVAITGGTIDGVVIDGGTF
jgi:hypothetical protein